MLPMSAFAGYRFPPEVILVDVRWYLRFNLSHRDLEELLAERGFEVDHVTVNRWVKRFTPLLIDAARFCRHSPGHQPRPRPPDKTSFSRPGAAKWVLTDSPFVLVQAEAHHRSHAVIELVFATCAPSPADRMVVMTKNICRPGGHHSTSGGRLR